MLKMDSPRQSKKKTQLVWGAALTLMGIAVFFRIPQVMPKLVEMGQSESTILFIRICFYILGILLVVGGMKKVMNHIKADERANDYAPNDNDVV
jgi:multisubunit Na+/H+ antiporter MnhG subunit